MPTDHDRLAQWWEGLSDEQRAAARAAGQSGQLDASVHRSLRDAGVLGAVRGDKQLPPNVRDFIKMRHDT